MQNYTDETCFKLNPEVDYTMVDDEIVIIGAENENLYGANPVAADVWKLLANQQMTISHLVASLCEQYDVEAAVCMTDMRALVDFMMTEKLIVASNPA